MTSAHGPVLETEAVRRVYRRGKTDVIALDGVTISVDAGEFIAVMGPSGSGKSTLVHVLGALDQPTEGDVRVHGRSLSTVSRRELARVRAHEIGFVFQAFNLVPGLNARDNVALPALLSGRGRAARGRGAELLERVGLGDAADATPGELSGGQQQRVAVARALIMDPGVVLADEPTGNLDSTAGEEILSLLEGTRDGRRTLVLVTHDQRIAARADRIVTLRDGRICEQLGPRRRGDPPHPRRTRLLTVRDG